MLRKLFSQIMCKGQWRATAGGVKESLLLQGSRPASQLRKWHACWQVQQCQLSCTSLSAVHDSRQEQAAPLSLGPMSPNNDQQWAGHRHYSSKSRKSRKNRVAEVANTKAPVQHEDSEREQQANAVPSQAAILVHEREQRSLQQSPGAASAEPQQLVSQAQQQPASAGPVAVQSVLTPPQIYQQAVQMGVAKANGAFDKTFLSALLAGAYVGYGGMLALSVGGACPELMAHNPGLQKLVLGGFGLPTGLLMVIVCGAELFTSNAAMLPAAVYEGKARLAQLLRNWSIAYSGNLLGALGLVSLAYMGGVFTAYPDGAIGIATYKASHSFAQAFGRGILCNWLVCLAVWQATAAQSLGGKAIGVFLPISAFVAMGLEHSVANMFIIPMGMAMGADVTVSQFLLGNLLPVTLGNIVAGSFFVATSYACVYGSLLPRMTKRLRHLLGR